MGEYLLPRDRETRGRGKGGGGGRGGRERGIYERENRLKKKIRGGEN